MVNRRCVCTPLSPVFIRKELVMTFNKHTSLIAAAVIASVLSNAQASSPKLTTESERLARLARLAAQIKAGDNEQTVSSRAKRLGKAVLKHKGKIALATTGVIATGIAAYLAYQAAQNGKDLSFLTNYTQSISETVQAGITSGSNVLQSGANQMSSGLHAAYNLIPSVSWSFSSSKVTPSVFNNLTMCNASDAPVATPAPVATAPKSFSSGREYTTFFGPLMQMPFDAYNYGVNDAFFLGLGDYFHMAGVQPN